MSPAGALLYISFIVLDFQIYSTTPAPVSHSSHQTLPQHSHSSSCVHREEYRSTVNESSFRDTQQRYHQPHLESESIGAHKIDTCRLRPVSHHHIVAVVVPYVSLTKQLRPSCVALDNSIASRLRVVQPLSIKHRVPGCGLPLVLITATIIV